MFVTSVIRARTRLVHETYDGKHSERLCGKIFSYMSGVGLCGRVVDLRHRLQQHARRITDAIRLAHASRSMTENRVLHVERHLGSTKVLDGRGYNPDSHAERDGQPAVDMFDAGPRRARRRRPRSAPARSSRWLRPAPPGC